MLIALPPLRQCYLLENLEDCVVRNNDIARVRESETGDKSYSCDMSRDYRPGWWNGNVANR
jgi:hypothetical protein